LLGHTPYLDEEGNTKVKPLHSTCAGHHEKELIEKKSNSIRLDVLAVLFSTLPHQPPALPAATFLDIEELDPVSRQAVSIQIL